MGADARRRARRWRVLYRTLPPALVEMVDAHIRRRERARLALVDELFRTGREPCCPTCRGYAGCTCDEQLIGPPTDDLPVGWHWCGSTRCTDADRAYGPRFWGRKRAPLGARPLCS
jgi:hypothetical protein